MVLAAMGQIRILGIAQIAIGCLMFLLGVLSIIFVPYWSSHVACGLWVGIWVGMTGLFGYLGARANASPNRCLIGVMIGFAVTACVLSGVMLTIQSLALTEFADRLRCPVYVVYKRPTGRPSWDYDHVNVYDRCEKYHKYNYYRNPSYTEAQAGAGLGSLMVILAMVEFFVALASSIYGCSACCCTGTPRQAPQPVAYQGGNVTVIQPHGGVPPGTTVQTTSTSTGQGPAMQGAQHQNKSEVDSPPAYSTEPCTVGEEQKSLIG